MILFNNMYFLILRRRKMNIELDKICGLCNLEFNEHVDKDNKLYIKCEICWKKIHSECANKYCCDKTYIIKCYDCGGSIIKTECCNINLSLDFMCAQSYKYWKLPIKKKLKEIEEMEEMEEIEEINEIEEIENLNIIKIINSDTDIIFNDLDKYKYIESYEFLMKKNSHEINCINCIINCNELRNQIYLPIQVNLIKNNFIQPLTNEIISVYTNIPFRD